MNSTYHFKILRTLPLIILFWVYCLLSMELYGNRIRYSWQYNTITHRLLQLEEETSSIRGKKLTKFFDDRYKVLDHLISDCSVKIKYKTGETDRNTIVSILRNIDTILAKNHFCFCVPVRKLSQSLELESKQNNFNCELRNYYHNYRKQYYEQVSTLYHIDCDMGSFIYLGIAEVLKLPLKMVEVPQHNFVRWMINDSIYINWDVNMADSISDDEYRKGSSESRAFNKIKEDKYGYLLNLSDSTIKGYYYLLIGRSLKTQKRYDLAQKCYELSISLRPRSPWGRYYLGYMIVFTGCCNSYLYANKLLQEAVEIYPASEYVEALACSLALLGKQDEAVKVISDYNVKNEELILAFQKGQTGIEVYKKHHNVID